MKEVFKSEIGKIGIALVIGVAIGAIFYPSKEIEESERHRDEQRIEKEINYSRKIQSEKEERVREVQGSYFKMEEELNAKIQKQTTEISHLKVRVSERTFKLIKPDGTIEERTFRDSELSKDTTIVTTIQQEYTRKIKQTEDRYKKVYTEKLEKVKEAVIEKFKEKDLIIATLEKKRSIKINPGKTRIGVGVTNEQDYYGIVERDIFGPIFIHGLFEVNTENKDQKGGIGIGIKF